MAHSLNRQTRSLYHVAVAIIMAFVVSMQAAAQSSNTEAKTVLRGIYEGTSKPEEVFSPKFLNAVPAEQIRILAAQMRDRYGKIHDVVSTSTGFRIITESHAIPTTIEFGSDGKVDGLLFKSPVTLSESVEEALSGMTELADRVSYLVRRDKEVVAELGAKTPLAVGSAFKLGVLAALQRDIEAGRRDWADVHQLQEIDRSLPTGMLQNMPTSAPLTLHSLASLMISISDNTATDSLMRILGRDAVETALGLPFVLTTREFFILKADSALGEEFEAANDTPETKRRIVERLNTKPLPTPDKIVLSGNSPIEWYLSAEYLCDLLNRLHGLDVLQINSGPISAEPWRFVSYKGGSETGVLNLSGMATGVDGREICVVATLNNNEPIDQDAAIGLYSRLFELLAQGRLD